MLLNKLEPQNRTSIHIFTISEACAFSGWLFLSTRIRKAQSYVIIWFLKRFADAESGGRSP